MFKTQEPVTRGGLKCTEEEYSSGKIAAAAEAAEAAAAAAAQLQHQLRMQKCHKCNSGGRSTANVGGVATAA